MTVRELIAELQKLEQDRGIWVIYDYPCDAFEPTIDGRAGKEEVQYFGQKGMKKGDYYINAG